MVIAIPISSIFYGTMTELEGKSSFTCLSIFQLFMAFFIAFIYVLLLFESWNSEGINFLELHAISGRVEQDISGTVGWRNLEYIFSIHVL